MSELTVTTDIPPDSEKWLKLLSGEISINEKVVCKDEKDNEGWDEVTDMLGEAWKQARNMQRTKRGDDGW